MMHRLQAFVRHPIERLLYDLRLRYKLMIAFSVIMLIPLLILGVTTAGLMRNNLEEVERKALVQSMRQLNNSVDSYLNVYLNASTILVRNYDLQQALNQNTQSLIDAIEGRQKLATIVRQMQTSLALTESSGTASVQSNATVRFYITNAPFASYLGDVLPLSDIETEPWYPQVYSSMSSPVWQSKAFLNSEQHIVLNRKITDFKSYVPLGVMRVFIPLAGFKNFIERNTPPGIYQIYYVDQNFQNVLSSRIEVEDEFFEVVRSADLKTELSTLRFKNHDYLVGNVTSPLTGWRLILITPTEAVTTSTRTVSSATIVSVVIAFGLCIIISIIISGFLTRRLAILLEKTNQVDKTNFTIRQTLRGNDEIGRLDANFNSMVTRIENLIQNDFKAKLVINKVKLELLQEQINPHLLYNTLSSVSMISKECGNQDVLNVTNHLIAFYKGILSRGKIITTIRAEIAMVMNYIELMRSVYKLDISCEVELEEDIFDYYTIKLLLQPVVENAILHGLRQKGGGQIFISGQVNGDALEFIVSDNGVGMPDEVKNFLNSILEVEQTEKGYGLANVIKRIDLFWGREYGVKVESEPNSGTTVILRIPRMDEAGINQRLDTQHLG